MGLYFVCHNNQNHFPGKYPRKLFCHEGCCSIQIFLATKNVINTIIIRLPNILLISWGLNSRIMVSSKRFKIVLLPLLLRRWIIYCKSLKYIHMTSTNCDRRISYNIWLNYFCQDWSLFLPPLLPRLNVKYDQSLWLKMYLLSENI